MRSPLLAIAAVCVVATASVLVFRHHLVEKPKASSPSILPVAKNVSPVYASVHLNPQPELQPKATEKKRTHFSRCDIAFIKPVQAQTIFVSGNSDTIVRFQQGTEIKVDPSDFVNERTGQPVVGPVKLQVKEYYAMEDILLQNLSTSTKDGLLETNGMINVQAFASNGEICKLKKDGTIEIRFPKMNNKQGMQLFSGNKKEDGTIIWQSLLINASVVTTTSSQTAYAKTDLEKKKMIDTTLNSIPEFEGGLKGIEKNINSIKNLFPIKNLNALVMADFNVDTEGYVRWVGKVAGNDEQYYGLLGDALYKMPQWKPAMVKGREKLMTMRLTVSFQVSNPRMMRFWSCIKSPAQNSNIVYRRQGNEFNYSNGYNGGYQESYANQALDYYTFITANLGWINCDRFYNSTNTIAMYVDEPVKENTSIKLIFHNIKSVINATVVDGKYSFGMLPKGEAVTLVALKGEKGNLQMAVKNMNVSGIVISGLDFKNVTKEEVRSTMAQFNKLPGALAKN